MTDWATLFPIGSVYRFDLQRVGLTNEQIDSLSELDMLEIAQTIRHCICKATFGSTT